MSGQWCQHGPGVIKILLERICMVFRAVPYSLSTRIIFLGNPKCRNEYFELKKVLSMAKYR